MSKSLQIFSKIPEILEKGTKIIGTHSGSFHADECLACGLLLKTKEYHNSIIVRSRDPKVLSSCDILVDVGGKYDAEKRLFDHHQREFQDTFPNFKTRLSSAGLIYKHFGLEIISQYVKNEKFVSKIYEKVYKVFVESIDGIDNGVTVSGDQAPQYIISTDLSSRVGYLGPQWNTPEDKLEELTKEGFQKAVFLAQSEFEQVLLNYVNGWLPARDMVEEMVKNKLDDKGEILNLEKFCPWQEHLYEIEKDLDIVGLTKYIIFKDTEGTYRVRAVSVQNDAFKQRLSINPKWWGLRDKELQEVSGVEDATFVHATGFIGGAKSFEGALKMAKLSVIQ